MTVPTSVSSQRRVGRMPRRTRPGARVGAFAVALVAVLGVVATWRVLVGTAAGQRLEQSAFTGALYGRGALWRLAEPVLDVVSVTFVVLGTVAAVTVALLRRRWVLALQVGVLVAGANLTTQVLKHQVLVKPDLGVPLETPGNSLPSGHTTVAASVAVALLLVVPRRQRPLVAVLGAGYTTATGVSTLVGRWHRPSDVIAAVLVVLAWTALVCACTTRSGLDQTSRRDTGATVATAGALGLAGLVAIGLGYLVLDGAQLPVIAHATATSDDVRAYVGLAAVVLGATAGVFAAALAVRQTTAWGVTAGRGSA